MKTSIGIQLRAQASAMYGAWLMGNYSTMDAMFEVIEKPSHVAYVTSIIMAQAIHDNKHNQFARYLEAKADAGWASEVCQEFLERFNKG